MTNSGRPITGFMRPGTQSSRPTSGQVSVDQAFKGSRPGTSRPVTSLGRRVRLGTASMRSMPGGPFINVDMLDLAKYAKRPAIAKVRSSRRSNPAHTVTMPLGGALSVFPRRCAITCCTKNTTPGRPWSWQPMPRWRRSSVTGGGRPGLASATTNSVSGIQQRVQAA